MSKFQNKKFCFLVMHELRCLSYINNLYEYLIDPYEADIIICCQDLAGKQDSMNLFHKNVIHKEKYIKPNPHKWYSCSNTVKMNGQNWNNAACLQNYINYEKMSHIVEKYTDKYDYFILTRTDLKILFPYPPKDMFDTIPEAIYSFEPNYSKHYGGFHEPGFVHKNYILDILRTPDYILKNNIYPCNIRFRGANSEKFVRACWNHKKIPIFKSVINNLNFFYIAQNLQTHTSWAKPQFNKKSNCFIKYPKQVDEAYDNLELWNQNKRWIYDDEKKQIYLN